MSILIATGHSCSCVWIEVGIHNNAAPLLVEINENAFSSSVTINASSIDFIVAVFLEKIQNFASLATVMYAGTEST